MWGGWLWLCRPALSVVGRLRLAELQHLFAHLFAAGVMISLERGVLAVLLVAAALWVWNWVSEQRGVEPSPRARPDYAAYFGLSEAQLRHYRASQTLIVHHDGTGEILGIDSVEPAAPFAAPLIAPSDPMVRQAEMREPLMAEAA
jgi:poly-beta-1,6-N-acetyl-D-glucosamine biosynthesis protein PgaD